MRKSALAIAAIALSASACRGGPGPNGTLASYGKSLRNHDFNAAYDLMSSSFRGKVTREDYVRTMRDNLKEVGETSDRLLDNSHRSIEVSAEFTYGIGDQMRLVQEHGGWRIAANPLAFYDQTSPQAALRSFVRAYKLKRWDVMMKFVPDTYREKMDVAKLEAQFTGPSHDNIELLLQNLENNLDEPIQVHGNEANMRYGDKYEVKFLKEDGIWKIKDLD